MNFGRGWCFASQEDISEENENVRDVGKKLMNLSNTFEMGEDGVDFKSILGSVGEKMNDLMTNFRIDTNRILPLTEEGKLDNGKGIMSTTLKNTPRLLKSLGGT